MNKIKLNIIALSMVSLGLFSCSESYLDVESETSIFDSDYYKTVDDFEMGLVGCYDGYQRTSSNGNLAFYVTSEVLSDNCFGGTGNTDGRAYQVLDRFDISESPSDNNLFNGTWGDYYSGIYRCNTLLVNLDNLDWTGNEDDRNRIEGETRFLRAKLYFDLVRLFNKVPLLTEPSTDNIAQSEPEETYKLIAEDLVFAAENIDYDAYSADWAADNDGRATQWAAKSLLARVYLFYTGYYGASDLAGVVTKSEVLSGLEDVINNGGFSLIEEYPNLWQAASTTMEITDTDTITNSTWAGRGNSEAVFTQKFNYTQDYNGNADGNRWLVMMGLRNTSFFPYGNGWGACTVNPELFKDFPSGDTRKTASIINIVDEGIEDDFDKKDQREYTGYSNKKYTPMCNPDGTTATEGLGEGDFQISQYQDFIVIRYADVLLMAAELGSANAQTYYDMVRTRAGLSTRTVSQENIMEERRFEFAFEGLRYWDLLRQGLSTAANTLALSNYSVLSGNADDEVTIEASNITATEGFMQIPNTQITLSDGVLKQNAGWE